MKRITVFSYGVLSYLASLVTLLYAAGFIGNFGVPKSMDSPADGPWQTALLVDLGLVLLFTLQHSIMARPAFKRLLTQVIPPAAERSTYLMASNLALIFLFWKWRPLGGPVWEVQNSVGAWALYAGYAFGWALLLLATVVINHFELFGLRQIWLNLQGRPQTALRFKTPWPYRVVRHPLYAGWITLFWSTPVMTVTHLFFAVITTGYIFVAIRFEERDLMAAHPEYSDYRRQVPMIVPALPGHITTPKPGRATNESFSPLRNSTGLSQIRPAAARTKGEYL